MRERKVGLRELKKEQTRLLIPNIIMTMRYAPPACPRRAFPAAP